MKSLFTHSSFPRHFCLISLCSMSASFSHSQYLAPQVSTRITLTHPATGPSYSHSAVGAAADAEVSRFLLPTLQYVHGPLNENNRSGANMASPIVIHAEESVQIAFDAKSFSIGPNDSRVEFVVKNSLSPNDEYRVPLSTTQIQSWTLTQALGPKISKVQTYDQVEIHIQSISGETRTVSLSNHGYVLMGVPRPTAVLGFAEDFTIRAPQKLQAGQSFELQYDATRLISQMSGLSYNGHATFQIVAYAQYRDWQGRVLQTHRKIILGGFREDTITTTVLPIPATSAQVEVWFEGQSRAGTWFDSDFGQNYRFAIVPL